MINPGNENSQFDSVEAKKKPGRPRKLDSNKKVRQTITLDPGTWQRIIHIAEQLGYEGGSTFINDIGKKLSVSIASQDSDTNEAPAMARLLACGRAPSSRLWSALSFIRTASLNLGLIKNIHDEESLIEDVTRRAKTALCLRSFLEPDIYIKNITGYTNWIAWHILQEKAGVPEAILSYKQLNSPLPQSKNIGNLIWRIVNTIELLSINYPGEYQIFRMHMMERLTGAQITRIMSLREQNMTIEEGYQRVRNVMDIFRRAWHNPASEKKLNQDVQLKWENNKESIILRTAQRYLELLENRNLKDDYDARMQIEQILLASINIPLLDTFIREIDHAYGHQISNNNHDYVDYQEKVRNRLYSGQIPLSQYFIQKLDLLKESLTFSGNTREEIYDKFMSFIHEETSSNLPEKYFLTLKKYLYEPSLMSDKQLSSNTHEVKEAFSEVCHHFVQGQKLPWEEIPIDTLTCDNTKLIAGCIDDGKNLICGYTQ